MATSHVISGLICKRAELDAQIMAAEERLRQLRRDLAHVDGAIVAFDPNFRLAEIQPKRLPPDGILFKQGELGRLILDVLRNAFPQPLTIRQISMAVIDAKGIVLGGDLPPVEVERRVERAVRKRDGRLLRRERLAGRSVGWLVT